MGRLNGTTVLVTGGGSGIGLETARALLGEGANVAIAGRDAAKLRKAADTLGGGDRLLFHPADVTDLAQVQGLMKAVTDRFGRIDVLVNNAGVNIKDRQFRQLTPETWKQLISVNLDGPFYCVYAVLPQMLERGDGLIVNVSSISGKRAHPLGGAGYDAAKFGMSAMGICLGAEEKDSGIRVTNIYPGEVDTPILANRAVPLTAEQRQKILRPEDVAAAVLFVALLPPRASVPELVIKPTTQTYV